MKRLRDLWLVLATIAVIALGLPSMRAVAVTVTGVDTDSAQTLSNKTLDTTNIYQGRFWQPNLGMALCIVGSAYSLWDLPATNTPTATCNTGSNVLAASLDYPNGSDVSAQITMRIPAHGPNGRGGYDTTAVSTATLLWKSTTTSGNVVWTVSTACTAVNSTATDDPSFNTANTVTSATAGTASRVNTATITTLTMTGCDPGEVFHLKVRRNAGSGSDTMAGTAKLMLVTLDIPRT